MKRQFVLMYAVAAVGVLVAVATFGSTGSWFGVAFLLLCPLMMMFMMGGMHGGEQHADGASHIHDDSAVPSAGRGVETSSGEDRPR